MPEPSRPSVVRRQTAAGRPDRNRYSVSVVPSASLLPDYVLRALIPPRYVLFRYVNQNANAKCVDCYRITHSYAGEIRLSSDQLLVRRATECKDRYFAVPLKLSSPSSTLSRSPASSSIDRLPASARTPL